MTGISVDPQSMIVYVFASKYVMDQYGLKDKLLDYSLDGLTGEDAAESMSAEARNDLLERNCDVVGACLLSNSIYTYIYIYTYV